MAEYKTRQLRNVAFISHGGAGKTSLVEAIAFDAGLTTRLGRVDEGNTISDYDPEEIRRHTSVNTSLIPFEFDGHKVNILDTPGYMDFVGEVLGAIRVADSAVVVVDAVGGVEVGTELVWGYADKYSLPRLVFINKMDRENADFERAIAQLGQVFEGRFVPLALPVGRQSDFRGVVDLVGMKAYLGDGKSATEIPGEMSEAVEKARLQLLEVAAEGEDELIMKYLDGEELTTAEILRGLRLGILSGHIIPVMCGAATLNIGVRYLMRTMVELLPSPADRPPAEAIDPLTQETLELPPDAAGPLAALIFKTMADPYVGKLSYFRVYSGILQSDSRATNVNNGEEERLGQLYMLRGKEQIPVKGVIAGDIGAAAKLSHTNTGDTLGDKGRPLLLKRIEFPNPLYSVAVFPKTKADLDKLSSALSRLVEEDPTLRVEREPGTGETILSGMGDSHVDIAARKLQQKFGVEITTKIPKVPYRETITKVASAQGRHKKQTGGRGQFGDVFIRFEPRERGSGFEFIDEIFGGAVPRNFIPAVEKGLREIMQQGVLAGYPTVDFAAALYDGSYHPVDSSEIAFKLAAHLAFKKAIPEAGPVLLEPIMNVSITVPEQYMGDVLGDLNTRRARVQGMEQQKGRSIITAQVPLAEMQRYATTLRSLTQGRGVYTMEFSHYDIVPSHIAEGVIAAAKAEAAQG